MIRFLLADKTFIPTEQDELVSLNEALANAPPPSVDFGAAFAKMFLTLIALILLLFISYWFIRKILRHRLERGIGQKSIHIIEKKMISPKTMLYIVEADGKKILLAESHLEIKKLETLEPIPCDEKSHEDL